MDHFVWIVWFGLSFGTHCIKNKTYIYVDLLFYALALNLWLFQVLKFIMYAAKHLDNLKVYQTLFFFLKDNKTFFAI